MNNHPKTTAVFSNLRSATLTELDRFYSPNTEDSFFIDAYGEDRPKKELIAYKATNTDNTNHTYLLPIAKCKLTMTWEIEPTTYNLLKVEGIEFINHVQDGTLNRLLVHISDFFQGEGSGVYGSLLNMVPLNSHYYYKDCYALKSLAVLVDEYWPDDSLYILRADAIRPYYHHDYRHRENDSLIWSDYHDAYLIDDDAAYPEDEPDTPRHNDHVYWRGDLCYTTREQATVNTIRDYHDTPEGEHYLKPDADDILSKYTVGFEVEKLYIDGNSSEGSPHDEEALFVGWETDSSCGVEGITNIYSLNNLELFEKHVNSSYYVNEDTNSSCGGHINICDNTNRLRFWHIKNWLGLWYAMYRRRLNNEYAASNKKACPYIAKTGPKYQAIREKTIDGQKALFELRLPSRVKTGHQLIRRFKLVQAWIKCVNAYVNEEWQYTLTEYDDKHAGVPDWANFTDALEGKTALYDIAADTARFINEHISNQTQKRIRYLLEQSKNELLAIYGPTPSLMHVIKLSYAFQAYCEIPDNEPIASELREEISAYL